MSRDDAQLAHVFPIVHEQLQRARIQFPCQKKTIPPLTIRHFVSVSSEEMGEGDLFKAILHNNAFISIVVQENAIGASKYTRYVVGAAS